MNKPEKIKGVRYDKGSNSRGYQHGYNQACDDFEPYIKQLKHDYEILVNTTLDKKYADALVIADMHKHSSTDVLMAHTLKKVQEHAEMNSIKAKEQYQEKWDIINGLPSEKEIKKIILEERFRMIKEHSVTATDEDLAKAISKRIRQ